MGFKIWITRRNKKSTRTANPDLFKIEFQTDVKLVLFKTKNTLKENYRRKAVKSMTVAGTILLAQDSTISKGVTLNKVRPLRTYCDLPSHSENFTDRPCT